jgi:hypothetical protein
MAIKLTGRKRVHIYSDTAHSFMHSQKRKTKGARKFECVSASERERELGLKV